MTFSAMYIASTGMIALSTGLQTVSNNLANIETNGYKTMRTNYSDLISETLYTGSGLGRQQVGRGSQVSTIQSMFTQGAFRSTESPFDLALAGDGFFSVRHRLSYNLPLADEIMYTRAGAFTLHKDGYLEDPSGNILQGWAMSLPRPGETPVRIGAPTDVKITAMTIPPQATSIMRQAVNLDAEAKTSYSYSAYALAERYAREQAEPVGEAARGPAQRLVWDPAADSQVAVSSAGVLTASNKYDFNRFFIDRYNSLYGTDFSSSGGAADVAAVVVSAFSLVTPPPDPIRASGQMTFDEFSALNFLALADTSALAAEAGRTAYASAYRQVYDSVYNQYSSGQPAAAQWLWEGQGFAGAWDALKNPPIDPADYSRAEHQTVYDQSGRSHVLTTYYQKNPHSENVWDYIVVCDPDDDARLDGAGRPVAGTALAGLLQKGKITFDANGRIKDIEAQDFDPAAGRAAYIDPPQPGPGVPAPANITIGGSYTGPASINAGGRLVSSARTYTLTYGYRDPATGQWLSANTSMSPPAKGFTWNDGVSSGFVALDTREVFNSAAGAWTSVLSYPGPYSFGDGLTLTINFDSSQRGPSFGAPGAELAKVTAHSEQPGWRADAPNPAGYFDLNVRFKNAPAQNIALNFGARQAGGLWLLDDVSTKQYGGAFVTMAADQDGYPRGDFSRLYVTEDGLVTGVYSNKMEIPLYQLSIYRFLNPWGLQKMGDNLFAVTRHSGPGSLSAPGENGAAVVLGGFLEQSNVDTATEIVNMIMTQRGFQANSKVVTTNDTVIATAIETKR